MSNDFIEINDNSGQDVVRFYVIERGESYLVERQRKRKCERESLQERRIAWVQRSGQSHKQLTET